METNDRKYNLDEIKEFIRDFLKKEGCESNSIQIFNTKNTVGDSMHRIYNKKGVIIDYCPHWWYLEVFGLTRFDFEELKKEFDYVSL